MRQVVFANHPLFRNFLESKLNITLSNDARLISHIEQDGEHLEILAVVALDRWSPHACEAHIASNEKGGCLSRAFLKAVYEYVFYYAEKERMTMCVAVENGKANNLHKRLKHQQEGYLRDALGKGNDAFLYGCTKSDYENSRMFGKKA